MATNEGTEARLVARIAALQQEMDDIDRQRKLRMGIGIGGFVLIMATVLWFMNAVRTYVTEYDTAALNRSLAREAGTLLTSPEFGDLVLAAQGTAMTHVRDALRQRVQAEMPQFEAEVAGVSQALGTYVENDLKRRLATQLADTVGQIQAALLAEYGNLPADQIQASVEASKAQYLERLNTTLQRHIGRAAGSLHGLQQSFDALARSPDYARLKTQPPERIANNLYAGILESALYNLQPERGGEPIGLLPAAAVKVAAPPPRDPKVRPEGLPPEPKRKLPGYLKGRR